MTMEAQCYICPWCGDDHAACVACDAMFAALKRVQYLERDNKDRLDTLQLWLTVTDKIAKALGLPSHTPANLPAQVAEVVAERNELGTQKDRAYSERNKLVAVLSMLFPASLERHPEEDTSWEDDWRWIVFIDLPTGQASWHIHDSELPLFEHLPRDSGRAWDGHTTERKYARLLDLRQHINPHTGRIHIS